MSNKDRNKNRKKKIITTLAIGTGLIGGGVLARKLLTRKPNTIITKPVENKLTNKVEIVKPKTVEKVQSTVIEKPKLPPVKEVPEQGKPLTNLGRRKSDIKSAKGNKGADLPKQPRQNLDVRKQEGLDLPKQPRTKLDLPKQPPNLKEVIQPNKLNNVENKIVNTVFPSSKLVSTNKVIFPRRLRLRVKGTRPNVSLPKRPRFKVDTPVIKPSSLEDVVGKKKPPTFEDVIRENLADTVGGDFPKLLAPSQVPSLGRVVRVRPYKKMVGGKLVTVKGYVRKNNNAGVLVKQETGEGLDTVRRETVRKVRELRGAARKRKEQIEINNLQYQKLLDDQVSNQNSLTMSVTESLDELDNIFFSIDSNLKKVIPARNKKSYAELIGEISASKPSINRGNLDGEFYDKSLGNLRNKVNDVIDGFDVDNQILKEIKVEKDIRLGELGDLRRYQKGVTETVEKELNKAKLDRKKAQQLLDSYTKDYDVFVRLDKQYADVLDDLRLKRLELENISPSDVGKEFYTKRRVELIKEINQLEKGAIRESGFKKEIEQKIKDLDAKISFLSEEKIKLKQFNTEFYKRLNRYENELGKIPTNKFFLTNEMTKKNEGLNRVLRDRVVATEQYLSTVEKDVKTKIDLPLKEIEKQIADLDNQIGELDVIKLRELAENNVKERELIITKADEFAERQYQRLKELLADSEGIKTAILENIPIKMSMANALAKGKVLNLDEALSLKKRRIAELRREALIANNSPARLAGRDTFNLKNQQVRGGGAKEMPHISHLKQIQSGLEKNRLAIQVKRDAVFSTLNNYNFDEVKDLIKQLRDRDLFSYYKNTNPELYQKLLAFEDLLENKLPNRFKYILEDLDFQISKIDTNLDFVNKELKDLLEIKPKLKIKTGEKVIDLGGGFDTEIKELTEEEFDRRIKLRHSQIELLTRETRKRTTLIPIYEKLNSNNFKVEGENSIFNNFRNKKLTPAQKEFYDNLSGIEKKFFNDIVEKDLDAMSITFFYLNRAKDLVIMNKTRKAKLKKVRSLIASLNVTRGADLRNKQQELLRLTVQENSGLWVLENYNSLNRLTNREAEILGEIEKILGITDGNAPTLNNLPLVAKISRGDLTTKKELENLVNEINKNKENLSLNEYLYFSNVLKERIKNLSNELYLNNFSDTVELVYL